MEQTIRYYTSNVYGNHTIYVADCDQRQAIKMISGKETLTQSMIDGLRALGFSFVQVLPPKKQNEPERNQLYSLSAISSGKSWGEARVFGR